MDMKSVEIPDILRKMNEIFRAGGFEAYLVGGAVRDMLLGKDASDWDIATNASPEQITAMFRRVIPTGIAHGTVTVHFMGKRIEVTTYRSESAYSDGRHPDSVSFGVTLEEDLSRRDFTMNAVAASLDDGALFDPLGGREDIRARVIRTAGTARERFLEDGLRPVRALRFSSQLNFDIDEETYSAIKLPEVQLRIRSVSTERFRDELIKTLLSDEPSSALLRMEDTGILAMFIPELAACRGCSQADIRSYHVFDVLDHNLYACDGAPKDNLTVRLAALFHDVGKREARSVERVESPPGSGNFSDIIHFYRHEAHSARIVRPLLARLKFPNSVTDSVTHLVENHMFRFEESWSDAAVRRFIIKIGRDNIDDLLALRLADMYGKYRRRPEPNSDGVRRLAVLRDRISEVQSQNSALSLKDLAVNGNDLIALGIPAGKRIGAVLEELLQRVLDDPEMNERERLLAAARGIGGA